MRTLVLVLIAAVCGSVAHAQKTVRPCVASEFGKPVTVEVEFVAKPNTYYAQNVIAEPYALRVIAVNGRELGKPLLIEYRLLADETTKAQIEKPKNVRTFEAYESVYQPPMATPWLAEGEQGQAFALVHVLFLRLPRR